MNQKDKPMTFKQGNRHVKLGTYAITEIEYKLIKALREMPVSPEWSTCHDLGMMTIGEGDLDAPDDVGWGTKLYAAFEEYGQERGEPTMTMYERKCSQCGKKWKPHELGCQTCR